MKPMQNIFSKPSLEGRAKNHGLKIRKCNRDEDSFMLVDIAANTVTAPAPMTLEQVEKWLDDLDKAAE